MSPSQNTSKPASGREELEWLFLSNVPVLNRICAILARRSHLSNDDAEEFVSWVTARIIADDYLVLQKFRGEAALPTYLTSVVTSLLRDFRNAARGRWRASANAQRLGDLGIRLEQLVVRDGTPLRQAAEFLRTSNATTLTDRQLAQMASAFPRRGCLRPIQYTADLESCAPTAAARADDASWDDEESEETQHKLMQALASLARHERELLRLVYWNDMSVADVSRRLNTPQKPLYRQLERILKSLRRAMEGTAVRAVVATE